MKQKYKILNLYAGIGGNRKLWGDDFEITAVEYDEATAETYKHFFPKDEVIISDAHQFLMDNFRNYDFIWNLTTLHSYLCFLTWFKMRYFEI